MLSNSDRNSQNLRASGTYRTLASCCQSRCTHSEWCSSQHCESLCPTCRDCGKPRRQRPLGQPEQQANSRRTVNEFKFSTYHFYNQSHVPNPLSRVRALKILIY